MSARSRVAFVHGILAAAVLLLPLTAALAATPPGAALGTPVWAVQYSSDSRIDGFQDVARGPAGAGVGDTSTGAAPKTTDRVRIGSITRSFTATVVLQLVDEKRLALGDKLSRYSPWVTGAKHITVRQLLNMISGLHNFTDVEAWFAPGNKSMQEFIWRRAL